MPDQTAALERILLAEYNKLKDEQVDRIGRRDQLVYANLTATAGVIAAVLTHTGPAGLLLLPPVCLVLGWTYVRNDRHVAHIKAYLRDDLGPRLGALAGGPVLQWEDGPRRRRVTQVAVELVAFVVPAAAALAGFWVLAHLRGPSQLVQSSIWVAESAATLLFGLELLFPTADDEPAVSRG